VTEDPDLDRKVRETLEFRSEECPERPSRPPILKGLAIRMPISVAVWIGFASIFGESVLSGVLRGVLFALLMSAIDTFRGRSRRR
jgi:hypothetical protein